MVQVAHSSSFSVGGQLDGNSRSSALGAFSHDGNPLSKAQEQLVNTLITVGNVMSQATSAAMDIVNGLAGATGHATQRTSGKTRDR